MYSDLLAYDEVCRNVQKDKQRINSELNSTEAARTYIKLKSELNNLVAKNNQLIAELNKLNTEYKKCVQRYNDCINEFQEEKEYFEGIKEDTVVESSELAECRKELEKLRVLSKKIEQAILHIASRSDEITKNIDANTADGKKKNKQYRAAGEKYSEEKQQRAEEIKKLDEKKAEAGKTVEPKLRADYDRIAESHRDPLAWVSNGRCSGCKMTLPTSMLGKVTSGQLILCENCGRMILGNKE